MTDDARKALVVEPGSTALLVVPVTGEMPADQSAYAFVVTLVVDGTPREVAARVSRATRLPVIEP